LVIRVRELGREHPATMQSRNGLASALEAQGKPEEAEREFRSLLATRERVLGLRHRDIYSTCYQLAMCLEKQAKYEDALKFIQRA
jgi:tetratricopeptide (TPR) repeat protein